MCVCVCVCMWKFFVIVSTLFPVIHTVNVFPFTVCPMSISVKNVRCQCMCASGCKGETIENKESKFVYIRVPVRSKYKQNGDDILSSKLSRYVFDICSIKNKRVSESNWNRRQRHNTRIPDKRKKCQKSYI